MKHLKNINSFINESNKTNLLLSFSDEGEYQKAVAFFDDKSEFYAHDTNDEFMTLYFECDNQADCDITEKALEIELIDNDINNYRFEVE